MIIPCIKDLKVQVHCSTIGNCIEKFTHHLCIHCSKRRYCKICLKVQIRSAGKVNCSKSKNLIHWQYKISVSLNSGLISKCLCDCLSQYDSCIFDRVMGIHFKIPTHLNI